MPKIEKECHETLLKNDKKYKKSDNYYRDRSPAKEF
jgi:hypothetical protein